MVVFDSRVVPGSGPGVYMAAIAEQLTNLDALESGMAVVSRESVRDGAGEWGVLRRRRTSATAGVPCVRDPIVDPGSGQPVRCACRCQAVTATPGAEVVHDRARGPEPDD